MIDINIPLHNTCIVLQYLLNTRKYCIYVSRLDGKPWKLRKFHWKISCILLGGQSTRWSIRRYRECERISFFIIHFCKIFLCSGSGSAVMDTHFVKTAGRSQKWTLALHVESTWWEGLLSQRSSPGHSMLQWAPKRMQGTWKGSPKKSNCFKPIFQLWKFSANFV